MKEWFRNQDICLEEEILIALRCLLITRDIPITADKSFLEARTEYINSTIKRIDEVLGEVKNV